MLVSVSSVAFANQYAHHSFHQTVVLFRVQMGIAMGWDKISCKKETVLVVQVDDPV